MAAATGAVSMWWPATGLSEESNEIRDQIEEIRRELRKPISFSWRESLGHELADIVQKCSSAGWDGYDAEPVSDESKIAALQLIEVLPEFILAPDVTPLPNGEIAFEWRVRHEIYFTISVSGVSLGYAGVFGGSSKKYGEERFFDALPPSIQSILLEYFPST
jgi:hypothetical protein